MVQRLDDDHLARRLEQAVARLDLDPLWQSYAGTGSLPCRPDLMLRVVLEEVQRGHHSPAVWHRHAAESEPVRWLLRGGTPLRSCWYAFRDRIAPFLDACHRQVLHQAIDHGLTTATRGAEDGTLVAANASRHKMVPAATTERLGHGLRTLLADTAYAGGADLAAAAQAGVPVYAPPPADGNKKEKQIPKSQFHWLGAEATYISPEGHRLVYEGSSRQKRSGTETVELHRYRCPPTHCRDCPLRERCTPNPAAGRSISRGEHEELIEALRARMATAEAKALYRWRSQTVALVNADWKEHRKLRRFSGRGLTRVRCQVGLVAPAHNLVTLLSQEKKAREKTARAADVKPPEAAT